MGKKSSHKKHRQGQPAAKPSQSVSQRQPMELASLNSGDVSLPQATAPAKPLAFGDQNQVVRSDIQRIGLLLLVVALFLIAAVIWNAKSQVLFNAGKHMASFMQLQNQ